MKKAPIIICAIALSLATTSFFTAGGTDSTIKCEGVSSMAAAAACDKVVRGSKRPMVELCLKVLRAAPPNSETTVYAYEATEAARDSCAATGKLVDDDLTRQNASLSDNLRAAYSACKNLYSRSEQNLLSVLHRLESCHLEDMSPYFKLAVAGIASCANVLRQAGELTSSRLYGKVSVDGEVALLAALLAQLATSKTSV